MKNLSDPFTKTDISLLDVKPVVERNSTNAINKMEAMRDRIYEQFVQACREEGIEALVLKSYPFSPSVWVKFECWTPAFSSAPTRAQHLGKKEITDRSFMVIAFKPKEFHQFECEMDIELKDGIKTKRYTSIVDFDLADTRRAVRYLLRRENSPGFWETKRCRAYWFQFWEQDNKLIRLKKDWIPELITLLYLFGFITLTIGLGILLIVAAVILQIYMHSRKTYVLSSGRPAQEPRNLIRIDSWQTLIYDLGSERERVKYLVKQELERAGQEGVSLNDEKIWYWGMDGKEEREQLAVVFHRGICFLHFYRYGNDLYVGWDAHLNCGSWNEKQLAAGIDPQTGLSTQINTITSSYHIPNEYDITDTDCLIEWVHGAVTKVIKRTVAEHKIDQEVDFTILRGQRQGIAGRRNPEENALSATARSAKSALSGLRFKRED